MIEIHYADHMRHEEEWFYIDRPLGSGDYLFLYLPHPMKIVTDKLDVITDKNACIFFAPDEAHRLSGSPLFVNSFVHFQTDEPFFVPTGRVLYPDLYASVNETVKRIKSELVSSAAYSAEMMDSLMREILITCRRSVETEKADVLFEQFEELRVRILSEPEKNYTVNELAEEMNLSRTQFYNYYKRFFMSSPKQDMLRMKMEKAATLLSDRSKTVKDVAKSLGFESVEHFTRYYKEYFSHTPRTKHQ